MKKNYLFFSLLFCLCVGTATAQDKSAARKQQYNLDNSVAIKGYDPVAYFKSNKAVEGDKSRAFNFQGVLYYFSSVENLEAFKKSPASYEPQYGGWCAFAMGDSGDKVTIDPGTFKITGGKLFLFYNRFFTNTLTKWNKDETNLHTKADANWSKIFH